MSDLQDHSENILAKTNQSDLMKNMECHFNWQLDCSQATLENLHQDLQDRLKIGCTWMCQLKNLLGYVLHSLGSTDKALICLREAEEMIKEQKRDEEKDCLLLVNQANLAWVHYLKGEPAERQAYLEEVTRLQEALPAPPGCQIHPELSAQKGWSLLKFERSHKKAAIECFEMALIGNPQKRLFHKGLALAMEKGYERSEVTPELQGQIIEKLSVAKQRNKKDICVAALYMINLLHKDRSGKESKWEEAKNLAEKLTASKCLDGLNNVLYLLMFHFKEYDKAVDVAERMLKKFPNSTRAKKNLATSLRWKFNAFWEAKIALGKKAIALYEDVNTPHSVKTNMNLAELYKNVGNMDAANHIYQSLIGKEEHLNDEEKQILYTRYGHCLYKSNRISESMDMYKKAVQIPKASDNRDLCIKNLVSNVRKGQDAGDDEAFLVNLLCVDCQHNGTIFLKN
ncbi:interferon-induced protein with tetratricopeptide repeats 2-like [Sardina pilchardus]|uniref:interferon-induced protein with tetratricopeptide repeats 2-like n=1 Tax=Sardina pilchardus TaxID=27697 RepID=UPI002E13C35F